MDWDKNDLLSGGEVEEERKKTKQGMQRQTHAWLMPSQFLNERWLTPLSSLLPHFLTEHDVIWHGISLIILSHLPGCVSSQPLVCARSVY